jgi:hypothetical protein
MNNDDIIAIKKRYTDLLITQYRDKPKAKATIEMYVELFWDDGVLFDLPNILNLENATGYKLDIIGRIVGVDRNYYGIRLDPNQVYFSYGVGGMIAPTNVYKGYQTALVVGNYVNLDNVPSLDAKLNDEQLKFLIKLKIIFNHTNGSEGEINDALYQFFGTQIILITSNDMEITYQVAKIYEELIQISIAKKILPVFLGVKTKVIISSTF